MVYILITFHRAGDNQMAGTSYTRQSTLTDGDTITAGLFNNEYNQIVSAFSYTTSGTTGHQHDGSAGQGGNIDTIGDQDFLNKIVVDTANNRVGFFIEVGGSAIEQVRVADGSVVPVTDNDVDLGSSSVQFKDLFLNGTANIDALVLTSGSTVTTILNEDNMSSDSDTALATQQSIKAYVDAQVTAQDLDLTDGTTVIAIDLDSETLSILGGTGITSTASGNGVTLAIDGTVTTLTGTQTLTNKTIDADNNTIQNLEVDNLKSGVLDTDISSVSSSDDTLPSAKAVKTYVDAQVTAQDLDFQGDSGGALNIDLDSETLTVAGGTGIDTSGATNTLTVAIDSTVATLTGTQTLTNKTLTTPTISGNLTTDGTIDGRDVAADGTKLDGIEASATADQTAAEIRTLVESATDSNVFTDADHTKLNAIEASATADQTDAEIRAAVEAATDSNVFTDADHSKLNAIEASADVTDTVNVTAAGALMDSEVTNLAQVKAFDSSDYATAAQGTTADAALPKAGGAMTGAITTNSTFDGRDVATDGAKLDGIEASADVTDTTNVVASLTAGSNITIAADGTIASTASGGNETLQQTLAIGNTTTTDTKIQFRDTGLYINSSADGQLDIVADTEVQIAATTVDVNGILDVSGNIVAGGTVDGRDVATDGTKLDGIETGATADQTAAQILTAIKTVDGSGSGLDADTVDGLHASSFVRSDADDTMAGDLLMDSANAEINIKSGAAGTSGAVNWTFSSTGTNYASIKLPYDTRASTGLHIDSGYPITLDATTSMRFDISGSEKMRIDSNGSVTHNGSNVGTKIWGVSNDGSGSGLDADLFKGLTTSSSGDRWNIVPTVDVNGVMEVGKYIDFHESDTDSADYSFRLESAGGSSGALLKAYGNLNLNNGATDGASLLLSTNVASAFGINNNGGSLVFKDGSTEKMRLNYQDRLGLGTTAPAQKLHVVGSIVATGNITAYYSDERLKNLIGTIPNALDKVSQLNGYYYTPNDTAKGLGVESKGVEVGVSAQEIETVLPEIIADSVVGTGYKTVMYEKITPLLIEAIKELSDKVDALETKLNSLEK